MIDKVPDPLASDVEVTVCKNCFGRNCVGCLAIARYSLLRKRQVEEEQLLLVDEMQANAAFIVEAVNSHASLKAKAYWLNQRNTVFVDAMAELVCGYLAELDNISKEVEG